MDLALEFINTFPCGTAKYCWLSYETDNGVAWQLYNSVGFVETDEKDGEEINSNYFRIKLEIILFLVIIL